MPITDSLALREWHDRARPRRLALASNQLEANADLIRVLADVETVVGIFHRARAIRGTRR